MCFLFLNKYDFKFLKLQRCSPQVYAGDRVYVYLHVSESHKRHHGKVNNVYVCFCRFKKSLPIKNYIYHLLNAKCMKAFFKYTVRIVKLTNKKCNRIVYKWIRFNLAINYQRSMRIAQSILCLSIFESFYFFIF